MKALLRAAGALFALLAGCRCSTEPAPSASPPASVSASSVSQAPKRQRAVGLTPLAAPSALTPLAVIGFDDAIAALPLGSTDSRPIVIVLGDRGADARTTCERWRAFAGYGFILCPSGKQDGEPHPSEMDANGDPSTGRARELRAALGALRKRFGEHVSPGPVVLAGVGRGARVAIQLARQEPSYFARLVLVGDGARDWSSGVATIYARGGGQRVLFACGDSNCAHDADGATVLSERAGLSSRRTGDAFDAGADAAAPGAPAPVIERAVGSGFPWLVEADASWRPPAPPP